MPAKTKNELMGERLKEIRKAVDYLQKDMAETLEVSQSAYTLMENGKQGISLDVIERLYKKFSVRLEYIFFGSGEMFDTLDSSSIIAELCNKGAHVKDFLEKLAGSEILLYYSIASTQAFMLDNASAVQIQIESSKKKKT